MAFARISTRVGASTANATTANATDASSTANATDDSTERDATDVSTAAPTARAEVHAADIAGAYQLDPEKDALLIADLALAANEAQAPLLPDAECVEDGGTVCRSLARAKASLGERTAGE